MAETTTTRHVLTAVSAVLRDIGEQGISKDRKNAQQGYSFRGIDDALNALNPIFAEHQLVILPHYATRQVVEREARGGGTLICVTVEATFDLVSAVDGSTVTVGPFWGEAFDSGDKASNKAQSAALKYCLLQTFLVPVAVEDADATTHEVAHKPAGGHGGHGGHPAPAKPAAPAPKPAAPAPKPAPKPAADEPRERTPRDDEYLVSGVEITKVYDNTTKSGKLTWKAAWVNAQNERGAASTFSSTVADHAKRAAAEGVLVNLVVAPSSNPAYLDLLAVEPFLAEPPEPEDDPRDGEDDIPFS